MASKKSAAQFKPVAKHAKEQLRPIDEVFAEAKDMFKMTVDTQVKTAHRIDNLLNIRDLAINFWGKDEVSRRGMAYLKMLQDESIKAYEDVSKRVDDFELDEFAKEEIKDYFEDIIPKVDDISTEDELIVAAIKFLSVQPYGSKLIQMHKLIQEELSKRA